jgi:hypothetical protein
VNTTVTIYLFCSLQFPISSKVTFKKNKLSANEKVESQSQKPKQKRKLEIKDEDLGSIRKRRRRSARIQGKVRDKQGGGMVCLFSDWLHFS